MTLRSSAAKRVAHAISSRQGVLGYLLQDERVLRHIDERPAVLLGILKASEVFPELMSNRETRETLALQEVILDWVEPARRLDGVDDDLILIHLKQEIDSGSLSFDKLLAQLDIQRLLDHLGPERLLDHLGPERLLDHLGPERLLDHLGPERLLDHLGPERLLDHLGPERLLDHLGPERLLNHLGPGQFVEHLGLSRLLEHIDVSHSVILGSVIENDKAFKRLLNDERAVKKVCLDESLKRRFRFINAKRVAAELPYRLPAVITSYPRSGSNFVQSVLRHSSGLTNLSIYASNPDGVDITLTVKSHAPSPEYLRDEFGRIVGEPDWPARIVLLQRDPRDVMISFYEYTQYMRQATVHQEDFLENTCFFYASGIDREIRRRVDIAPLSVLQAYKKHVQEWFTRKPATVDCLIVKYEDLLAAPVEAFQRMFDYLDLDCPLASEYLTHEVSLYDDTRQHRAQSSAWKGHAEKYRVLLDAAHATLSDEMHVLGYEIGNAPVGVET